MRENPFAGQGLHVVLGNSRQISLMRAALRAGVRCGALYDPAGMPRGWVLSSPALISCNMSQCYN